MTADLSAAADAATSRARFQALARAYTRKPVFMSSLVHLPALTCAFSVREKIAIFTANSETLAPMKELIKDECGVEADEDRYVFVGCEARVALFFSRLPRNGTLVDAGGGLQTPHRDVALVSFHS